MITFLRRINIKHRILAIVALGIVGTLLMVAIAVSHVEQQYIEQEKQNTKNLVDSARNLAEHFYRLAEQGKISTADAKRLAANALKDIGLSSRSYVYIYHDLNFMVMHPLHPHQSFADSTPEDLATSKAINDQQLEQHRVRHQLAERRRTPMEIYRKYLAETAAGFFNYVYIVDDDGLGFIAEVDDPHIPKGSPTKMGYGTDFKPWQWTILGGVYLGDLEAAVNASIKKLLSIQITIVVSLIFLSWLVTHSITKPLTEGMVRLHQLLQEKNFLLPEKSNGDEIERLGDAFNTLIRQLDERDKSISKNSAELEETNRELLRHKLSLENTVLERTQDYKTAKEKAEDATKAKSQFLATMTHELRTPMSGVLGIVDCLKKTGLNPAQQEYVDIISASGKQLLDIVGDILNFEKLVANKLELEHIPFNLKQLVHELVRPFQLRITENEKLEFIIDYPDSCPAYLHGDPTRIKQVLNNFLSNAYKFTAQGSITTRVATTKRGKESFIKISVIDTGIGLSQEKQQRLFQDFQQADKSTARNYGGTGLGLSISKKIVELMGGEVTLESQEQVGSTFSFDFSLQIAKAELVEQSADAISLDAEISLEQLQVLVAEDNAVNQMVIKGYLRGFGIVPTLVENGELAVQKFQQDSFDIVLMDINMPIMDGVAAAAAMRKIENQQQAVPIFIYALTADTLSDSEQAHYQAGMNGTLSKPIDVRRLKAVLQDVAKLRSDLVRPASRPNVSKTTGNGEQIQ